MAVEPMCAPPFPRPASRGVSVDSSAARGRIYISREGPEALNDCFPPPSVSTFIISPRSLVTYDTKDNNDDILPLSRFDKDIAHPTVFSLVYFSSPLPPLFASLEQT
ncbi:hypothetical protein CSUB01_03485 [Colletotrichum sublineola]|uniref:Uncharacterized protein n=1 Tax=Colletotrichum sublineola TaxID=1173701 RepID=A0A066XWE0_COLSU|nr:hypothetical protein CSUB01_03485 [Colletotrichum sublineola]